MTTVLLAHADLAASRANSALLAAQAGRDDRSALASVPLLERRFDVAA